MVAWVTIPTDGIEGHAVVVSEGIGHTFFIVANDGRLESDGADLELSLLGQVDRVLGPFGLAVPER